MKPYLYFKYILACFCFFGLSSEIFVLLSAEAGPARESILGVEIIATQGQGSQVINPKAREKLVNGSFVPQIHIHSRSFEVFPILPSTWNERGVHSFSRDIWAILKLRGKKPTAVDLQEVPTMNEEGRLIYHGGFHGLVGAIRYPESMRSDESDALQSTVRTKYFAAAYFQPVDTLFNPHVPIPFEYNNPWLDEGRLPNEPWEQREINGMQARILESDHQSGWTRTVDQTNSITFQYAPSYPRPQWRDASSFTLVEGQAYLLVFSMEAETWEAEPMIIPLGSNPTLEQMQGTFRKGLEEIFRTQLRRYRAMRDDNH